jgi:uncharacterized protein (TIGR02246 family)
MSDTDKIRELLETYEKSLNLSDAELAVSCYAPEGVFIPTGLPASAGAGLLPAYVGTFEAIRLAVKFTFDEIVVVTDSIAYVLTRSNGTQTVLATGTESVESNREIFILKKYDGSWKIERYMFNKPS